MAGWSLNELFPSFLSALVASSLARRFRRPTVAILYSVLSARLPCSALYMLSPLNFFQRWWRAVRRGASGGGRWSCWAGCLARSDSSSAPSRKRSCRPPSSSEFSSVMPGTHGPIIFCRRQNIGSTLRFLRQCPFGALGLF